VRSGDYIEKINGGTINASGFVNPFNPCLPHASSRTCRDIVSGTPWAPFNADDEYYFIWD
jgi:hypothetical protein